MLIGPLFSPLAMAHVSFVDAKSIKQGQSFKATFAIPHGCGDSATKKVTIQMPEGVINVKAMPKANWSVQQQKHHYQNSYTLWEKQVSSGVSSITWQGTLPNDQYDEFTFTGFLAQADNQAVYFPVTQTCEQGQFLWIDTTGHATHGHDAKTLAAPFLTVQ